MNYNEKKLDNSIKHNKETTRIWRQYNREISGSDFIGANIYSNILKYRPNFQSEILEIMYNEGYKAGQQSILNKLNA